MLRWRDVLTTPVPEPHGLRHTLPWTLGPVVLMLTVIAVAEITRYLQSDVPQANPTMAEYPVRGIDLSAHNGYVDFEAVRDAGYGFVLLKATEGTDFADRMFLHNYRNAKAAGLAVGAYHFFRFDTGGTMQALNLMAALRGRSLDLPVVIDVEEWSNPGTISTDSICSRLNHMLYHLHRRGYKTMLYTNKHGHRRFVEGRMTHLPLWLCSFSSPEGIDAPGGPVLWQYTHQGEVPGVKGNVDLNVFCGDSLSWIQWLEGNKRP